MSNSMATAPAHAAESDDGWILVFDPGDMPTDGLVIADAEYAVADEWAGDAWTQADPDFVAMMRAKDVPLAGSQAEADKLREWLSRPSPTRRPLPPPLPLDE